MPFQKQINLAGGILSVSESQGKVELEIAEAAQAGGGEAKGVCQVEGDAKVIISAKQAVDLGFAMIEAHLPTVAALIAKEVQAFADKEINSL